MEIGASKGGPRRILHNERKMTQESALFALRAIACDTPLSKTAQLIKEKFNIDISTNRLSIMKSQVKWGKIYDKFRMEYLGKCGESTGVYIADRTNRLKIAQELLEECLHSATFLNDRDRIETALKCLRHAQDETKQVMPQGLVDNAKPNILNFIENVNIDKKDTIKPVDSQIGEVINGELVNSENTEPPAAGEVNSAN